MSFLNYKEYMGQRIALQDDGVNKKHCRRYSSERQRTYCPGSSRNPDRKIEHVSPYSRSRYDRKYTPDRREQRLSRKSLHRKSTRSITPSYKARSRTPIDDRHCRSRARNDQTYSPNRKESPSSGESHCSNSSRTTLKYKKRRRITRDDRHNTPELGEQDLSRDRRAKITSRSKTPSHNKRCSHNRKRASNDRICSLDRKESLSSGDSHCSNSSRSTILIYEKISSRSITPSHNKNYRTTIDGRHNRKRASNDRICSLDRKESLSSGDSHSSSSPMSTTPNYKKPRRITGDDRHKTPERLNRDRPYKRSSRSTTPSHAKRCRTTINDCHYRRRVSDDRTYLPDRKESVLRVDTHCKRYTRSTTPNNKNGRRIPSDNRVNSPERREQRLSRHLLYRRSSRSKTPSYKKSCRTNIDDRLYKKRISHDRIHSPDRKKLLSRRYSHCRSYSRSITPNYGKRCRLSRDGRYNTPERRQHILSRNRRYRRSSRSKTPSYTEDDLKCMQDRRSSRSGNGLHNGNSSRSTITTTREQRSNKYTHYKNSSRSTPPHYKKRQKTSSDDEPNHLDQRDGKTNKSSIDKALTKNLSNESVSSHHIQNKVYESHSIQNDWVLKRLKKMISLKGLFVNIRNHQRAVCQERKSGNSLQIHNSTEVSNNDRKDLQVHNENEEFEISSLRKEIWHTIELPFNKNPELSNGASDGGNTEKFAIEDENGSKNNIKMLQEHKNGNSHQITEVPKIESKGEALQVHKENEEFSEDIEFLSLQEEIWDAIELPFSKKPDNEAGDGANPDKFATDENRSENYLKMSHFSGNTEDEKGNMDEVDLDYSDNDVEAIFKMIHETGANIKVFSSQSGCSDSDENMSDESKVYLKETDKECTKSTITDASHGEDDGGFGSDEGCVEGKPNNFPEEIFSELPKIPIKSENQRESNKFDFNAEGGLKDQDKQVFKTENIVAEEERVNRSNVFQCCNPTCNSIAVDFRSKMKAALTSFLEKNGHSSWWQNKLSIRKFPPSVASQPMQTVFKLLADLSISVDQNDIRIISCEEMISNKSLYHIYFEFKDVYTKLEFIVKFPQLAHHMNEMLRSLELWDAADTAILHKEIKSWLVGKRGIRLRIFDNQVILDTVGDKTIEITSMEQLPSIAEQLEKMSVKI